MLTDTNAQPHWIDQTGGDTVWGVTVTNTAVFVGGHNRWMNNPYGVDSPQPGAVPRAGLQALDPVSGRAVGLEPGPRPAGRLAPFAFLATSQGLWMGSDTDYIGNYAYKRPKLAMFPWAGGTPVASHHDGDAARQRLPRQRRRRRRTCSTASTPAARPSSPPTAARLGRRQLRPEPVPQQRQQRRRTGVARCR